jgi:hypothetical protein
MISRRDLYRVKVPGHRANDRITGLILGRSGRPFPRFPRVDLCFPVLCGDIVGSTMGSTVDHDLQSAREDSRPSAPAPKAEGTSPAGRYVTLDSSRIDLRRERVVMA